MTGFAIDHGNGALWDRPAYMGVSHTASAHVADNIFVGAGRTGRRNYLHKGRFIIFFNVAGLQSSKVR